MEDGARADLFPLCTLGRLGVGYCRGKLDVGEWVSVGYWGLVVKGYWVLGEA